MALLLTNYEQKEEELFHPQFWILRLVPRIVDENLTTFWRKPYFGSWIVKELNDLIEMTDAISESQTNINLVIAHQKRGEVGMT